jgi:hypothetical protein
LELIPLCVVLHCLLNDESHFFITPPNGCVRVRSRPL